MPNDLDLTEAEWKALLEDADKDQEKLLLQRAMQKAPEKKGLRTRDELAEQYPQQRRDLICPECSSTLALKDSKNGVFYGCIKWHETGCKGSHSAHKTTGAPMGVPATAATKELRREAHEAFDQLWKTKRIGNRRESYRWLADKLKLPESETHIANFDDATCRKVIALAQRELRTPNRFELMDEWDGE